MRAASSSSIGIETPYCWKMKMAYGVAKVTSAAITAKSLLDGRYMSRIEKTGTGKNAAGTRWAGGGAFLPTRRWGRRIRRTAKLAREPMASVRNTVAPPTKRLLPNWPQKYSRYQWPSVTTIQKLPSDGFAGQISLVNTSP